MLENIIENIGLTKKEARVYLAALEIGSNPVSSIAKKAKINRVTAYDIMEKLAKRGLVGSFTRAKVKYYTATDPQLVAADFQKKVEDLQTALPQLKQLSGEVSRPKVMSFEGIEAIKNIFLEALATEGEILMYANIREIETHWPSFMEDFERRRMNYELPLKLIAIEDDRGRFMKEYDDEFQRTTRLVPKEQYGFSSCIFIYDHKVASVSLQSGIGIVMEDPGIAETHRALFRLQWKALKREEHGPTMIVRKVGALASLKESQKAPVKKDQTSLF